MLFSDRVRRNLEHEVLAANFDSFFSESFQKEAGRAGFESPAEVLRLLQRPGRGRRHDAAVVVLLRVYGADVAARRRLGALMLLLLWPHVAKRINIVSARLSRSKGFTKSDADDIAQTLAMDVVQRVTKFDPAKASLKTFVARLVENCVATLVEERRAAKRDPERCRTSLNSEADDGDGVPTELWQTLDGETHAERPHRERGVAASRRDLAADIESAVRRLPPDLRKLVAMLRRSSVTEIARATGIPRGTLHGSIVRLRERLAEAGLGDYLQPPPASRRRSR